MNCEEENNKKEAKNGERGREKKTKSVEKKSKKEKKRKRTKRRKKRIERRKKWGNPLVVVPEMKRTDYLLPGLLCTTSYSTVLLTVLMFHAHWLYVASGPRPPARPPCHC